MDRITRFWRGLISSRHFDSSDSRVGGATVVTMSHRALGSDAVDDEDLRPSVRHTDKEFFCAFRDA